MSNVLASERGSVAFWICTAVFREMLVQVVGAFRIACAHAQFLSTQFLKVGWLRVHEQLVHGRDGYGVDQSHVHSHADFAEVVHGFFTANLLGRA